MEISRRTDYAIRLIAALVSNDGKPLSVREAAALQEVPYAFARSIQHDLVKNGVIQSVRGAHGGMLLNADPEKLTLFDLIEMVQGPVSVSICTSDKEWCSRSKGCKFHRVWDGANKLLRDYLSSVSIKDIMAGECAHVTKSQIAN